MGEIVPFGLRLQGFRQSWSESRDGRAAKLGSQKVTANAKARTVKPLRILPEIIAVVKVGKFSVLSIEFSVTPLVRGIGIGGDGL